MHFIRKLCSYIPSNLQMLDWSGNEGELFEISNLHKDTV